LPVFSCYLQAYAVAARKQAERPSIVHTSLYLPEPVYESLRKIAFEERLKIHDIVLEGIDAALRRRGYPSVETLKPAKSGGRAYQAGLDGEVGGWRLLVRLTSASYPKAITTRLVPQNRTERYGHPAAPHQTALA
jgi:hypothetical protein